MQQKSDFGYVTTYPMSPRDRLKRILKKKKGRVRIYKGGTYASKRNGKLEKWKKKNAERKRRIRIHKKAPQHLGDRLRRELKNKIRWIRICKTNTATS